MVSAGTHTDRNATGGVPYGSEDDMFEIVRYVPPDFSLPRFVNAPDVSTVPAPRDGVVPDDFYATTIFPEYFKIGGEWILVEGSRMDCCIVIRDGKPYATEFRRVKCGEAVVVGRTEDGSGGVFVHSDAFACGDGGQQAFCFRTGKSRETSYSMDYDLLYELLRHERDHGYIVFVLGPAATFDYDGRNAMAQLIEHGFVDALFAGNALATHDLEAAFFHTALGQDIYTKTLAHNGHYHHIETINRARRAGVDREHGRAIWPGRRHHVRLPEKEHPLRARGLHPG